MNIQECIDQLNFWANKVLGQYYTPDELTLEIDRAQMSLYNRIQPRYATSQRIKDALAPFKETYSFTTLTSVGGVIQISNTNFLNLLDISLSDDTAIAIVNEDVRATRLKSQVDPVTANNPVGEMIGVGRIQLYPKTTYTGTASYLRRPIKPVYGYLVISGRPVYDPSTSTQLEWRETQINEILVIALQSLGINLSDQEVMQWGEMKGQQKY